MSKILHWVHNSDSGTNGNLEFTIEIGKNSSIGVVDGNFGFERTGDNEITIYPTPNIRTLYGTIVVSDNNDPTCYEEKYISVNQQNYIYTNLKSDPLEVSSQCCVDVLDNEGNVVGSEPVSVRKKGAIVFNWDEWIKCIEIDCYNPYICAYLGDSNREIDICVNTCEDIKNVKVYICGYDKCGDLLRKETVIFDIIHTDIKSDGECDCKAEMNKKNSCADYDCNNPPNLSPDPDPTIDPDEPLEPDGDECELIVDTPVIKIPYRKELNDGNGGYGGTYSFNYTSFTSNESAVFNFDNQDLTDAHGLVYGKHYFVVDGDTGNTQHKFAIKDSKTRVDLCYVTIKYEYVPDEPDSPELIVTPENGGDDMCGKLIFFCEPGNINNMDIVSGDCQDYIELDYTQSHKYEVNSGTATWSIYSYDASKVMCKKSKSNGKEYLTIQLIDYSPVYCEEKSEIVLKNSADQFCSIYFVVDEGLVLEDTYVFQWDETAATSCESKYYSTEEAICNDYYCEANNKEPFKLISWYSLAIDKGEIFHTGDWSWTAKGAVYKFERYTQVTAPTRAIGYEWREIDKYIVTQNLSEPNLEGWYDTYKGNINIYVGDTEGVTNLKEGDVRITSETTFSKTTLLTKPDGGNPTSRCYIDFTQVQSGLTIRLYIVHPGVIKYRIYTDQIGNVKATVN